MATIPVSTSKNMSSLDFVIDTLHLLENEIAIRIIHANSSVSGAGGRSEKCVPVLIFPVLSVLRAAIN